MYTHVLCTCLCLTYRMTCTWALMTSVSATVKPSSTLESSINFFHPQSCSFLQKRCSVSAIKGAKSSYCSPAELTIQVMHLFYAASI